ncbi:hypothetical protein [Nocardia sputi]|nr:hypothetical protein [Nocardia sputi]MBF6207945.1 hypothetical protein [Streptomyces gardneri]
MRTPFRLAAASVAAAALVVTPAGAAAQPVDTSPPPAPGTAIATGTGTGSSAVDHGSSAVRTGLLFLQQGNVIGILVLLAAAPLQILTSGICDLATGSALPNPCAPSTR